MSLSACLCLCMSVSLLLFVCLSVPLSVYVPVCLSLSTSISISMCLCPSQISQVNCHLNGKGLSKNHIAANHSDFGGILSLLTQYPAIPIGMNKFRQNLKKSVMIILWTGLRVCKALHPRNIFHCFVSSMLLPAYTYF